ncbi:glycosyltransferase family 2 protein [Flavobacterium agricola]|uniref:Glycosyltransferase family 2 protein n=1 Tax=Flavobacterium agricola TaxID=2870839 RepID=A0ABY6LX20_9FLAO|nr:glycosyltransferase family A protein [Flavobacterium agricola]UYW00512.1 glycosyltransferase family 2 protein [Flavobacterium agricola]
MITIITTFKNRELERVNKHLESLTKQINKNFKIVFIDYGSDIPLNISNNNQLQYFYLEVKNQPFNKSKAINYVIKNIVDTKFIFIADVDMIFAPNFIDKCYELSLEYQAFYFQVAYLKPKISDCKNIFNPINFSNLSNESATGMMFFKTKDIVRLGGYDEFMHFYGAEDTDVFLRLKKIGINAYFYNENNVLMAHQWHKKFIESYTKKISQHLQLSEVWRLNQIKKNNNRDCDIINVNGDNWGNIHSNDHLKVNFVEVFTYTEYIDFWLFYKIHNLNKGQEIALVFREPIEDSFLKKYFKKILNISTKRFYTLKQVNDLLLLQIISHLHNNPYSIKLNKTCDQIVFRMQKI